MVVIISNELEINDKLRSKSYALRVCLSTPQWLRCKETIKNCVWLKC